MISFVVPYSALLLLLLSIQHVAAFSSVRVASLGQPMVILHQQQQPRPTASSCTNNNNNLWVLHAGGFEWEDPGEAFDQGVENPYKNAQLLKQNSEEGMKIDPARLLGPRLGGTNLYFVGMMGTGKSTVGNVVARRECPDRVLSKNMIRNGSFNLIFPFSYFITLKKHRNGQL
jgi:hypothetical protein